MSQRSSSQIRHPGAGCLQAVRLGVRSLEAGEPRVQFAADDLAPGAREIAGLRIEIDRLVHADAASWQLEIENRRSSPVSVEAMVLGFRWSAPGLTNLRFLRHGWQSWSFTGARDLDAAGEPAFPSGAWLRGMHHCVGEPPADRQGWHESDLLSVVGRESGGAACLAGVLETGLGFGVVYLRRDSGVAGGPAEAGVAIEVELRLEVELAPGERRRLEAVRVALGEDANRLLESFAELWGRQAGARTQARFQAGWCSWYQFFHAVREDDLLRNLDALAADREGLPVEVVQLDDGYQRSIGDWLETNERFPSGLPRLAQQIRAAGFDAGLWTAPVSVVPESRVFQQHPEWLLRGEEGEPLRGTHNPAWSPGGWCHVLDPSRDDVCRHLEEIYRELTAMGFSYLKLDFLYMAAMRAQAFDAGMTRAARLRRALEAVRVGAGESAFVLGCGCPLGPAVGIVDGMRIGPDVAPSWQPQGFVIPGLEAAMPATGSAIRSILNRAFMHRRLWLNDPDCLMARGRDTALARHEVRSLAAAIATSGGMVVFSDDVPALSPAERANVRECIELAREIDGAERRGVARAAGLLEAGEPRLLLAGRGADAWLAAINCGDTPLASELALARLGLAPESHADAPLRLELPAHGAILERLSGARRLAVFCDFDGTFSVQDVGSSIARRLLAERRAALWQRWERGEIAAWDYILELFDGFEFPSAQLDAFLADEIDLDPGAAALVDWCEKSGVPLRILSDGFDHNLERLRSLKGVRFDFYANRLRYEGDVWRIEAGHPDPSCGCGTGTCKAGLIAAHRARHPGAFCVHIGNGHVSDLCGALAADLVFAKDSLAPALAERGAFYVPFRSLDDVVDELERRFGARDPGPVAG